MLEFATNESLQMVVASIKRLDDKFVSRLENEVNMEMAQKDLEERLQEKLSKDQIGSAISDFGQGVNARVDKMRKKLKGFKISLDVTRKEFEAVEAMTQK